MTVQTTFTARRNGREIEWEVNFTGACWQVWQFGLTGKDRIVVDNQPNSEAATRAGHDYYDSDAPWTK